MTVLPFLFLFRVLLSVFGHSMCTRVICFEFSVPGRLRRTERKKRRRRQRKDGGWVEQRKEKMRHDDELIC